MTFGPFFRIGLALAVGTLGGALFAWAQLPLPWMLGAMAMVLVAALAGAPVAPPTRLRTAMFPIIGLFIGSVFSPDIAERIVDWPLSTAILLVYVAAITVATAWVFARFAGFDRPTALFAAVPGGMSAIIVLSGEAGGRESDVALAQSLRVLMIVFGVPWIVIALSGPDALSQAAGASPSDGGTVGGLDLAVLGLTALGSIGVARLIRLPAAFMTGPMIGGAALYLLGVVEGGLPEWLLDPALVVLGASVGARFAGIPRRRLLGAGGLTLATTSAVTAAAAGVAWVTAPLVDVPFVVMFVALVPGGVGEIALIAVALGIDPAFVAFHHLTRITVLLAVAPWIAKRLARGTPRKAAE